MKLKWEKIADNTERLKVYKGWLVRSTVAMLSGTLSMCFVPDKEHIWEIE